MILLAAAARDDPVVLCRFLLDLLVLAQEASGLSAEGMTGRRCRQEAQAPLEVFPGRRRAPGPIREARPGPVSASVLRICIHQDGGEGRDAAAGWTGPTRAGEGGGGGGRGAIRTEEDVTGEAVQVQICGFYHR